LDGLSELVELGSSVGNMVVAGGMLPEGCMARAEIQGIVFGVSAESMLSVVVTIDVPARQGYLNRNQFWFVVKR
jgi:hypothetical protein